MKNYGKRRQQCQNRVRSLDDDTRLIFRVEGDSSEGWGTDATLTKYLLVEEI